MGLSSTNALVNIQDGQGSVTALSSGSTRLVTPGALLTFSLQSTTGVARWTLSFKAPAFPTLDNLSLDWFQGMNNSLQVQLPQAASSISAPIGGIEMISTVSDGSAGIGSVVGFIQTRSATAIPFQHQVRACAAAALAAYTISNGVITITATGALAAVDGVTLVAGDRLLLPNGLAATATDAGVYVVTNAGGTGVNAVLTVAPEWPIGQIISPKTEILVSEGTLYKNTTWVVTNTGTVTIGTTSITFYPRMVSQVVTLAAFVTVTNVPILAVNTTQITFTTITPNVTANTVRYQSGAVTSGGAATAAGALGTASASITAVIAAGTYSPNDTSTGVLTIANMV